ncbi:PepSY-like domain-containing protein [Pedobacter xixiisoli]|uniref:Beta-lactamase-inhibitor-like, PepSY-like n=1 Tax=Pedobacter xixiisoli TaxID=1476464 RepID=A0A286A844_9SPHI|nr:PepSY-like domain-containing protein [Pedobacter xixiisoli]SOD18084.1 Putative beta-lactamase-inhibitor-like, PepSY-like [Pedobacter xixiisoli]
MKLFTKLFAVAMILFFASCDKDDTMLSGDKVPLPIGVFVSAHFPNNAIIKAVKNNDNNKESYDISLEGNFELEFDENFGITSIEGNTRLPNSVIPPAILTYVTANYPNQFITDWELESNHQQIELNNGLNLEFNMDGSFIKIER